MKKIVDYSQIIFSPMRRITQLNSIIFNLSVMIFCHQMWWFFVISIERQLLSDLPIPIFFIHQKWRRWRRHECTVRYSTCDLTSSNAKIDFSVISVLYSTLDLYPIFQIRNSLFNFTFIYHYFEWVYYIFFWHAHRFKKSAFYLICMTLLIKIIHYL